MFDPDNKMPIAMAKGTSKNIKMRTGEMTFREFGLFCSMAQQGRKHESYFTRGVPAIEEEYQSKSGREYYNGRFRHDSSIPSADFLIIDADNSDASPKAIHEQLESKELAHFIYTSHSHGANNNFRVVLPCTITKKEYMVATAKAIIDEIEGVDYVTEMGVWSQAWYLPTRDDPDDNIFEYYEYMEGTPFLEVQKAIKAEKAKGNMSAVIEDVQSMAQMIKVITSGGEGMHHAMKSYSYGAVQDGQAKAVVKETLRGLMMACPTQDGRWQTRFDDIDRLVDGVGVNDENPDDLKVVEIEPDEDEPDVMSLNWPPGLMGQMCHNMYNSARYPNKVIACNAPLAIIAGIAGRSFNISEMGLNLYQTFLMNSGGGKNHIGQFAKRVLNSGPLSGGSSEYLLGNEFSGAKSLLDELHNKRCGLSIQNESGFKRAKQSGDQSGLQGQILQLFSSSGQHDVSDVMMYSDSKNNTKIIQAPCLSIVEESTPDKYLDALREGTQTGQLNRMYIFRAKLESTKMNRTAKFELDHGVMEKVKHIMAKCKDNQKRDMPEVIEFEILDDMYEFADKCKDDAEEYVNENPAKFTMLQRSHEKAWKVACVITLFNEFIDWEELRSGRELMKVSKEAWKWAKELHEFEMSGLDEFFQRSGNNSLDEIINNHMLKPITTLVQPKGCPYERYTASQRLSTADEKMKTIPLYILKQRLRKCQAINDLGSIQYGKSGLITILKYLEEMGDIELKNKKVVIKQSFFINFRG